MRAPCVYIALLPSVTLKNDHDGCVCVCACVAVSVQVVVERPDPERTLLEYLRRDCEYIASASTVPLMFLYVDRAS